MDLDADIPLYESDMQKIRAVGHVLNDKRGSFVSFEGWTSEVEGRFADAGYKVDVVMGVEEVAGVQQWNTYLRIVGRIEPKGGEYDHEQQAAEIQAAEGGRITGAGLWRPN